MDLAIADLHKSFGRVEALRGVSLAVESGEFFAILGPSGAGKTTLLRIIAGIEQAQSGTLRTGGRDLSSIPVRARNTAMVFQTFALYPHLTTFENLAYPLREQRLGSAEIKRRVGEIAEMLRLSHTLARKPGTLSGGEQQRCAIGRALIRRPALLLLDEPLTNLDAKLRHDTRAEFKRLHRELGHTTIVYATPDQLEALSMGSRVAVLRGGRIVQVDTPFALYDRPGNEFVASLVGDPPINLVPGQARGGRIELPFTAFDAGAWRRGLPDGAVQVGVRPQGLTPASGRGARAAVRRARVPDGAVGRRDHPRPARRRGATAHGAATRSGVPAAGRRPARTGAGSAAGLPVRQRNRLRDWPRCGCRSLSVDGRTKKRRGE